LRCDKTCYNSLSETCVFLGVFAVCHWIVGPVGTAGTAFFVSGVPVVELQKPLYLRERTTVFCMVGLGGTWNST
jgi:hypothetical protein